MTEGVQIRAAVPADIPVIVEMIGGLSSYHGDVATATAESLQAELFGERGWISALIAEDETGPVGYAIMCPEYRAHLAQRGMDLHHLYVNPERRKSGVGRLLIKACVDQARAEGCVFFVVPVADQNTKAQQF
ncbi:MAG: GNAT family N-acetyltransferase, partial [Rhodospirillales bacterium]|nr:GNAT family N-acetyltransferase [Rhodospirillales bacterium]